jgi:S-adenosylmethionine:tRNA ribosyltransferase-isomerase
MKLQEFDYELPEHLIAQTPLEKRDHSRLLNYNRKTNQIQLKHFYNILDFLNAGDVIVVNNTRVIPARLFGKKEKTGAKMEVLLLKKEDLDTYTTLIKPLKRLNLNESITFDNLLRATLIEKNPDDGTAILRFSVIDATKNSPSFRRGGRHEVADGVVQNGNAQTSGAENIEALLEQLGHVPLPHYITKNLDKGNEDRYQTVYNKTAGSAAAPTAGLHWTPELMQAARDKGIIFAEVLLHVGLGTFRPVKVDNVADHKMHAEYYEVPAETAEIINNAKAQGRRVIAVGTTSMRTLEGMYAAHGDVRECSGETDIFIYPPSPFHVTDALITNFHLPKSTLLMLISAFLAPTSTDGIAKCLELYELAVREQFRFFSFGDCMLIE